MICANRTAGLSGSGLQSKVVAGTLALLAFGLMCGSRCFAEGEGNDLGYSGFGMVFKVIVYLVLIIGLFLFIIKMMAQKNKGFMPGRTIKTWGGVSLGQNKSVQIVQIGHSLYVLGVGDEIRLLEKIDDLEEIEYIRSQSMVGINNEMKGFPLIRKWFAPKKAEEETSVSFQQMFQQRMDQLSDRHDRVEQWIHKENKTDRSEER
ncbi:flagellar biosynthetic protein FliO [Paenibacillus sp. J2TS4]|uniref:flagellar biosynthetic protein FliO n=1 Tax=Paenibacillus sp. J2TS4 TaxID=2807194 RepID=UPI001B21337A|nr:flagellar biosynthetic protein FliO [Paenibacillus sp. J2TS4]GIP33079.1 hypothetical protein J2TS4_22890 [Paenibacillus sp. J2TS4]